MSTTHKCNPQIEVDYPWWGVLLFVIGIGGFSFLTQYAMHEHLTRKSSTGYYTKIEAKTNQWKTVNKELPKLPGIPLWYFWLHEEGKHVPIVYQDPQ